MEKGGALMLNVFTNETRMRNIITTIEKRMGGSNMLFKYVPNFDRMNFTVPKQVLYEIYGRPFLGPGREPFSFSSLV